MKLAIFDIDGTLIDSSALDTQCFLDAFDCEFGLKATAIDWSDYVHHTDRGLVYEFLNRAWSRAPSRMRSDGTVQHSCDCCAIEPASSRRFEALAHS